MIRILYRTAMGHIRTDLAATELREALQEPKSLMWLDVVGEPPEVCEPILRDSFGFHPLAIDDALTETHIPKLDDWEEYLYIVLRWIVLIDPVEFDVEIPELDVFLGNNYIVTYHDQPIAALDRVWQMYQQDKRASRRGVSHILYRLTDEMATGYLAVIETLDDQIDQIEDQLFDEPTPSVLEIIFNIRRTLIDIRRMILPQREVFHKLSRSKYQVVKDKDRVFFRDVYDHLVRVFDRTESMREMVASALNTYLTLVNNKMNDVVKTLTIITTLFMPLSFITGFFGMNFFQAVTPLDVWTSVPLFVVVLLTIIFLPVGMLLWVQRRGWM